MTRVHPMAVVDPDAHLDDDVEVGPFCVVGSGVVLGAGTRLLAHVVLLGPTQLGQNNVIHPFVALGGAPQDRSYRGEPTRLWVGDGNEFREHVTVHRGTTKDQGLTRLGHHSLYMAGCHVAHDVTVGDHVTLANATLLGGHVVVGDHVATGGHTAIQPFVRLGESCFLAGGAMVERDVPPFVIAAGDRARVRALNRVGLARRDVPPASMEALHDAFRLLFGGSLTRAQALAQLTGTTDPWVRRLVDFLAATPR